MELKQKTVELNDMLEVAQMALKPKIVAIQFLGTFLAISIFFTALSIAVLAKYTVLGILVISAGLLLGYPLFSLVIHICSILQLKGFPPDFRAFLKETQPVFFRTIFCALICAGLIVLLAIPQAVLLMIGTAGTAGEILLALFLLPMLILTLVQIILFYMGLFVAPQILASEAGDLVEIFQKFKEMILISWKRFTLRHILGMTFSVLFAFPSGLAINLSIGILGAMAATIVGNLNPEVAQGMGEESGTSLAILLFSQQVSFFSPVWLQFNTFAQYLIGIAAVFAFAIPITLIISYQSANGLLAIREMVSEAGYSDYPPYAS